MKKLIALGLGLQMLSGCATSVGYWGAEANLTETECLMRHGDPFDCAALPEYGFGDWENTWAGSVAQEAPGANR